MELTAEQIQSNWDKFIGYINPYITDPRREKLIDFYSSDVQHLEKLLNVKTNWLK